MRSGDVAAPVAEDILRRTHRTHGVTFFHGCYTIGDDTLWGVNRQH
ncbi:hypothetical protein ACWC5I_41780 [Kitasatospora sp. NPDC001574]